MTAGVGEILVRPFREGDEAAWEQFVFACPQATFFHRIGWRKILNQVFRHRPHYLLAERGGVIVGVLPLAEMKTRLFGHALISLPFCVYGGVASEDPLAIAGLHDAARRLAQELGVAHLELRNMVAREPDWPRQELYVTFRKTLSSSADENMLAIPRKQRAMVRKGIKNGLTSEIDPGVAGFFDLYADNVHRHGTPGQSKKYFEALRETFGESCEVLIIRDSGGRPVSGVMSFYFRDEVLPYYAGDFTAARDLAANDFKYWELIRRSGERGIKLFDYGRSKLDSGSFSFKKNWGFEPAALHYEHVLVKAQSIPQNNPNNPKYQALIAAWRRMPRPVVNMLGPMIVRGLG